MKLRPFSGRAATAGCRSPGRARTSRSSEGRIAGDGDGLVEPAYFKLEVESNGFSRRNPDTVARQRAEPAQFET